MHFKFVILVIFCMILVGYFEFLVLPNFFGYNNPEGRILFFSYKNSSFKKNMYAIYK